MEQIIVQVKDKKKAKLLQDLLLSLDFVDVVKTNEVLLPAMRSKARQRTHNFFALAGIWKERDIDLMSIRKKAWPRQHL